MGAVVVLVVALAAFLLFAGKLVAVLSLVVAFATFSFPIGLLGLVGIGVLLTLLLSPRHNAD